IFQIEPVDIFDLEHAIIEILRVGAEEVLRQRIDIERPPVGHSAQHGNLALVAARHYCRAVRRNNELHVGKRAGEHPQYFLLPAGMQVRIDLVDEYDAGPGRYLVLAQIGPQRMQEAVNQAKDRNDRESTLRGGLDRDRDILAARGVNENFESAMAYPFNFREAEFLIFRQLADDLFHQSENLTRKTTAPCDPARLKIVEAQLREQILNDIFKGLLRQVVAGTALGQRLAGRRRAGNGPADPVQESRVGDSQQRNLADRGLAGIVEVSGVADDFFGVAVARHFDSEARQSEGGARR